ncbi:uncharacterized protein LOC121640417 [Melanotaenia boesemani]|uniref:uncharacterized protein LOC121640417 n=1 Tax=Melanotaenia boesemani TaxID=1250792 RepID=UPI001C047A3E|nr:uncharacterized protein LOC121640417 [Melanotaenia boesemani]
MKMLLVMVLLLHVSQHALPGVVEVNEGAESVLLPCEYDGYTPEDNLRVMWTRNDLSPRFVHQRGQEGDLEEQNQLYRGRTSMKPDALDSSDFSLSLRKPHLSDSSIYTCSISNGLMELKVMDVELKVKGTFPSWATAVLVLVVSAGVLYHFRSYFMSVYQVEVESGAESVLLPCRTTVHLPGDARVEWKDSYRMVHVYQNGSDQPEDQNEDYRTRTVMERKPLQSGDLSLTLKLPTDEDSRTYTCIVYSREGNILMMKQVRLTVRVPQVEVESGVESVLLPCRTTVHLPEEAKVEWKYGNYWTVHVYQNGSDQPEDQDQVYRTRTVMERNPLQPGDLSLTLKLPTDEDNGTFTCRVYSREGNILMKKQVGLTVRVYQVEVESGAESVLLPCRTTVHLPGDARVEWKDSYRMVHVYQNGSDQPEDQDQVYRTRTVMERNPLQPGDLSLTLKLPTDEDNGTFTCRVYSREGNILMKKQVGLTVRGQQVEVESGVESVLLPCRTTVHLPGDAKVEWKDDDDEKVHVYQNGSDKLEDQYQVYRTRTVMERKLLQPGDLSLTLKLPTDGDSRTFTCRVYSREGNILMEKQVLLTVRVPQVEVESGVESVLLPCRTTVHLPGDAKVEWKDLYRTVHVYQNGSDQLEDQDQFYRTRTVMERNPLQSGDLSLTLKLPTDGDSRIFTCRVYSKEGNILMKKQVRLTVRGQQVEVESGVVSVLLPCRTTVHLPGDAKVEWKDGYRTVHVYQNGSDQLEDQHQFYRTRTVMERNPLQSGDLSLTLKHPTDGDSRTFTCSVYSREGNILMEKQVLLTVRVYQVEVESGVESVLLPCRTTVHLPGDAKVEWKDLYRTVHVYQNGSDQLEDQDQFYRTRTVMERNPLQSGDLSLTLKLPTDGDSRTFTCSVYSKEGNILMKKQVRLTVRVPQVEVKVESGVESVLLPCRTTVPLPEDSLVEWKDSYYQTVHVYQNGSDQCKEQGRNYRTTTVMERDPLQSRNLSLTLKHPTDEDSTTFTCRVYSRERNILMEKQVQVTVRVPQVEVESGVKSVLLPCRTTVHLPEDARVEWKETDRKVHVYQNGSDQPGEQDQFFRTRTVMERNPLQSGDLSLTLKHPKDGDNRTFTCSVYSREGNILMKKQIHLTVRACQVEVEEGAKSVLLPFRTTPDLPEDAKVEWRRDEPKPVMKVHVYQNGSDQCGDQDQVYINRTKIKQDPLKTGDLSLTLKHPKPGDSGRYRCEVWRRENLMRWKTFQLKVKGTVRVQDQTEDIRTRSGSDDPTPLMADQSV